MHDSTTRTAETPFESLEAGAVADMTYMNASGHVSERRIEISSRYCSRAGIWYLRAYCHLRGEERTFREDRVLSFRLVRVEASRNASSSAGRAEQTRATPSRGASRGASASAAEAERAGPAPSRGASPAVTKTATPVETRPSSSGEEGHVVRRLLGLIAAAAVIVFFAARDGADWTPRPEPTPAADTLVARVAELAGLEDGDGAPAPPKRAEAEEGARGAEHLQYRGEHIDRRRTGGIVSYSIQGADRSFASLQEARLAINRRQFVSTTGISNHDLLRRYAGADADGDGDLDWEEIRVFQERLYQEYRYLTNTTALTPDAFFRNGGGDCEDWALVTAGLLQFWQIPVYLASIASDTGFHAIALVRTPHPPAGALYFTFEDWPNLPDGKYVPIDYDAVGDLTNAVGRDYRVRKVWVPHTVYNHYM